jgi:hypothetical protein
VAGDAFKLAVPGRQPSHLVHRQHERRHGLDQLAVPLLGAFQLAPQALAFAVEGRLIERAPGRV